MRFDSTKHGWNGTLYLQLLRIIISPQIFPKHRYKIQKQHHIRVHKKPHVPIFEKCLTIRALAITTSYSFLGHKITTKMYPTQEVKIQREKRSEHCMLAAGMNKTVTTSMF